MLILLMLLTRNVICSNVNMYIELMSYILQACLLSNRILICIMIK